MLRSPWAKGLTIAAAAIGLTVGPLIATGSPAPKISPVQYIQSQAAKPYMGWSSWSLQSTNYPGLNPRGSFSWLTENHVLQQADVMASTLRAHGYTYINIDAGWWRAWDWTPHYDRHGRPAVDRQRFPDGIAYVGNYVHRKGLKLGIYMPVGMEKGAYDEGDFPIAGTANCSTHDIVYRDLRTTNAWDSSYKIDFSQPCAQSYYDSIAAMFARWGVDFLKLDGVGPGSEKTGSRYDNRADVRAWAIALAKTHRPIQLVISWSIKQWAMPTWQAYTNGWRIDVDVECYCDTLVRWEGGINNVRQRFTDVLPWISEAGPGGWNNLDSLDVGNGRMDGLTRAERQSYMTFWAIEAAPLYSGDDLTRLDPYGIELLTNDEVIAVDQTGIPARPLNGKSLHQVWYAINSDGSYTVALFNLRAAPATVGVSWQALGFAGPARVRDLWAHTGLGMRSTGFTSRLPVHGSRLVKVYPQSG